MNSVEYHHEVEENAGTFVPLLDISKLKWHEFTQGIYFKNLNNLMTKR